MLQWQPKCFNMLQNDRTRRASKVPYQNQLRRLLRSSSSEVPTLKLSRFKLNGTTNIFPNTKKTAEKENRCLANGFPLKTESSASTFTLKKAQLMRATSFVAAHFRMATGVLVTRGAKWLSCDGRDLRVGRDFGWLYIHISHIDYICPQLDKDTCMYLYIYDM